MNSHILKKILRVLIIWLISSMAAFFSSRPIFASTNVGGRISTNTTWTLAGSPYIVTSSVVVYGTPTQTAKLTIEPGVQVKFNANYIIQIGSGSSKGALYAVGTAGSPIIFTSNKPSPARGDWDSIKFLDAADDALTAMTYCTVEYGGSNSSNGMISVDRASPSIANSTIRYSKYAGIRGYIASPQIAGGTIVNNNTNGIYTYGQSVLTINGTLFSGNGGAAVSVAAEDEIISTQGISGAPGDRVQIRGGNIDRDLSWRNLGVPYSLSGTISVYKDSTTTAKLTIESGVQVRFNGNHVISIGTATSKGALYAVGTEGNPILFTSDKTTPLPGDWDCIRFYDAADDALTAMTYCTVEYGGSNSSNGMISIDRASPSITNSTIRYSKYMGIRGYIASPQIAGGTIVNNNTNGIYTYGQSVLTINGTSFSGNGGAAVSVAAEDEIISTQGISGAPGDRVQIRGGNIDRDLSWRNLGVPYSLSGTISVYKDSTTTAKLTIESGVQVRFSNNYMISIGTATYKGALYAVGTEGNPILFTSDKTTPQPGDWDCIKFYDAADDALTAMTYCTVEYGGSNSSNGMISIDRASPSITNSTIRYSKYMGIRGYIASPQIAGGTIVNNNTNGIYTYGQSVLTINGTSFSGNGGAAVSVAAEDEIISTQGISGAPGDRVQIRGGNIDRDLSWRNLGIPYSLSGTISVYKDSTTTAKLTIEPGVQVRFSNNYMISIGTATYKGALYAVGTEGNPILFTSDKTTPLPGDWDCIRFYDAADDALSEMTYCTVEYGGSNSTSGNMYVEKATPKIKNCTIRYSLNSGIRSSNANLTIMFCSIHNNKYGIYSSASDLRVNQCNIYSNSQYGVYNTTSAKVMDARFNWWGHSSGPSGQGPGSGDVISNYVAYEPWLGLLYSYPYYISDGISTTKQLTTNGGLSYFFAKADDDSNWTIIIKDSAQQTVRTFAESGKRIRQAWDGKDQSGQPLPAGSYFYQIQAQKQSDLSEATPLLGIISINPEFPIGFISFPLPGDFIAGTISLIGTANDSNFKDYKLEYGLGPVPSSWVEIIQSTTPVSNGPLGTVNLMNLEIPYVAFRLTVNDNSSLSTVAMFNCILSAYKIVASPNPFSPNNDGKKETTTITASFYAESSWTLEIKDPPGLNTIRTYAGSGTSLAQEWDGRNESGIIQSSGIYPFTLSITNPLLQEPNVVNSTISLDNTPPTAQVTDPTEGELFSNVYGSLLVEIFGTANDGYFNSYKLEYGETANPSSWSLIGEFSSPVNNNKLGELNTSQLANGEYTIRLTVLDLADNESSAIVHVRVGHLKLLLSSHQLNSAQGENVIITTEVPFNATETIVIKDKNSAVVRTLVDNLFRNSGTYNDPWDAKNNSGINVQQGAYYVVVSIVVAQDQWYFLLDLTDTGGLKSQLAITFPSVFSPYKGEIATFSFNLEAPAIVDLFVRENLENGRTRNLFIKEPLASGNHSIYWDGTDDNGALLSKPVSGLDNYVVSWLYSLSDNGIVAYGERPEATSLSANPVYFSPVDKEYPNGMEISYSISKTSDVNIFIQNSQGNIVKTIPAGTQSPGPHAVNWDGRANNGELAQRGAYRVGIELTDSVGNISMIRYCLVVLFY